MKQFFVLLIAVGLLFTAVEAQKSKSTPTKPKTAVTSSLKTTEDKMSYLSGYDLGLKVKGNVIAGKFPFRNDPFVAGIKEALEGIENRLTPEEIKQCSEIFQKLQSEAQENARKQQSESLSKVKKEGEDFLAANAKKDSVKITASGLQYKILREGTGASPKDTNSVTVHYRGHLINGKVFDESYSRNEPSTFQLKQVIKGWTEGLQLMKEGAKFEFYIPNNLAWGDQAAGADIPAGAVVIFEVELIKVQ